MIAGPAVNEEVRRFLIDILGWDNPAELADDFLLLDQGVLDSLGLLELVRFLEDRYDLEIDEEDLVPEHFQSVAAIGRFVTSRG